MKKTTFTLLIILCSIQIANSQTGWQWVNPYPQGNTLEQVQMLNSSTGYAVTTSNAVIKTINGGVNWSILLVNSSAQLFSVFFTDVNTGYVCGNNGSIYKTINGGTNWAALQSGTTLYMDQVYFINANTGFVSSDGAVLRTTNAGVNWTIQTLSGGYFYGPCFPNATTGYLCGQGSSSGNVYKTTNMGQTGRMFLLVSMKVFIPFTPQMQIQDIQQVYTELYIKQPMEARIGTQVCR
jgi:hypothetical protein